MADDSKSGARARRPRRRKRLGQHHLRRRALCRPLVDFLRPSGRRVVEIGPGGGVLTGALVAAGARVTAVELDPAWALELRRRLPGLPLAVADAALLAWERLAPGSLVAGNLPYGVATPIVRRVLAAGTARRAGFLVQLEVARRLAARPGDPDYGSSSVLTAARAEVAILGRVRAADFRPPPRVDGAFIGLTPRRPPLPAAEMPGFEALVRLAFAHRRKTLRNALAAAWGRRAADRLLAAAGLGGAARAEALDLAAFVELDRRAKAAGLAPSGGAEALQARGPDARVGA